MSGILCLAFICLAYVDEVITFVVYFLNFLMSLFKFELQFYVRLISFNTGLLHNLNTPIPFRILMIIYFLITNQYP